MIKKIILLIAAICLTSATFGVAADIQATPDKILSTQEDIITVEKAADFLIQTTELGLEEMGDSSLEAMVCTPHALPRKLFFQVLCDCATDPETKVSDLEILALAEEADRSGESDEETALTLRDVNQDTTSYEFFFHNPAADASAVTFAAPDQEVLATGNLPDGWATKILRTGSASF